MPDGSATRTVPGRIGPNSVWQLVPLLDRAAGRDGRDRLLSEAGVADLVPADGRVGLIDERSAARLHRRVRETLGNAAPAILHQAGVRTADYILANRIPAPVRWALIAMPDALASPALSRAIARNSWTFAGSGEFSVETMRPPVFVLGSNPLVAGETRSAPACHWHVGVFERLFRTLVSDAARVKETECCAGGNPACRFHVAYK